MNKLLFILIIAGLFISCSKRFSGCYQGELKNLTGLDGCGWVIELNDGTTLEPTNLSEFENSPQEGQKVCVKYEEIEGASICMVGKIVEITDME